MHLAYRIYAIKTARKATRLCLPQTGNNFFGAVVDDAGFHLSFMHFYHAITTAVASYKI